MRISVALCTYNGARFLEDQLQSILAQTRQPDELVVCDDQSTDQTPAILQSFARRAPFPVRVYINEVNLGSTKNFEKVIALSAGEIIALCDQDDVWHKQKLAAIEQTFVAKPNAGLVFSDAEMIDDAAQPLGWRLWQGARFTQVEQELVLRGKAFEVLLQRNIVTGATMAFRATYKELVLPIESTAAYLIHDGWIALLISLVAELVFIPEPLIDYRRHSFQQVGIGHPEDWYILAQQRTPEAVHTYYTKEIEKLRTIHALLNQVRERNISGVNTNNILSKTYLIEQLIAHYQVRGNIPPQRIRRLLLVAREVATLRYHKYSKGIFSAAKDILA